MSFLVSLAMSATLCCSLVCLHVPAPLTDLYNTLTPQLDSRHVTKDKPAKGMLVVKIGGPAYRIGMGGGYVTYNTIKIK